MMLVQGCLCRSIIIIVTIAPSPSSSSSPSTAALRCITVPHKRHIRLQKEGGNKTNAFRVILFPLFFMNNAVTRDSRQCQKPARGCVRFFKSRTLSYLQQLLRPAKSRISIEYPWSRSLKNGPGHSNKIGPESH